MASQAIPTSGAIFMSSYTTRRECFERCLFGLPNSFAKFVRGIKSGMILFLFEYEERKLYGVFKAVSDGAINIMPHAYRQTGKSFPAQVKFDIIWRCKPLLENEFRDAIRDNYYAGQKFSFALSEEQVHRLLFLFDSKKIEIKKPLKRKFNYESSNPSYQLNSAVVSKQNLENEFSAVECENVTPLEVPKSTGDGNISPNSSSTDFHGTEDFIPLYSSEESEDSDDENFPKVKGMYSDVPSEKASIFSRLKKMPKAEKHKDLGHDKRSITRANVFSRLSFASVQENGVNQKLVECLDKIKEQKKKIQEIEKKCDNGSKLNVPLICGNSLKSSGVDDDEISSSQMKKIPSLMSEANSGVKIEGIIDENGDKFIKDSKTLITQKRCRGLSGSPPSGIKDLTGSNEEKSFSESKQEQLEEAHPDSGKNSDIANESTI